MLHRYFPVAPLPSYGHCINCIKKNSNKTKTSRFVNNISQLTGEVEKGAY